MIDPAYKASNKNVNNGAAPGLTAAFFNNIETFLQSINAVALDNTITSDGSGNEHMNSVTANKFQLTGGGAIVGLLAGSISRISFFSGTSNATVNHNLGAVPSFCVVLYAGGATPFGSPPTHPIYYYNLTTSQITVVADSGYSWLGMAIHV